MDDFGSGYSSLNMLAELPIDILKLDMKFLQNKGEQSKNENIMSSIVALAKKINLYVIAEGVEKEKHISMLKSMKCDMVQGYYYLFINIFSGNIHGKRNQFSIFPLPLGNVFTAFIPYIHIQFRNKAVLFKNRYKLRRRTSTAVWKAIHWI